MANSMIDLLLHPVAMVLFAAGFLVSLAVLIAKRKQRFAYKNTVLVICILCLLYLAFLLWISIGFGQAPPPVADPVVK